MTVIQRVRWLAGSARPGSPSVWTKALRQCVRFGATGRGHGDAVDVLHDDMAHVIVGQTIEGER
ncbi:hypothetical protein ACFQS7_14010 [Dankookia sp. GCM10030260]|uniref:hypothetical protein n=1 Tax=Dankookia sp. GCM10030260 TaxID=3273390 RepID=UPI003606E6B9